MPPIKKKKPIVKTKPSEESVMLKALGSYLVKNGANANAMRSKADRFSRLSTISQTPYGTYGKPLSEYGKFYSYGGLSYKSLRLLSKSLLVQAIHSVRKFQAQAISKPIKDKKKDIGWRIIPIDYYEEGAETSDREKETAKEIEQWLKTPHRVYEPSIGGFITRFVNEHLTINRVAIELFKDGAGRLQGFGMIDGALVEPTYITLKKFIDGHPDQFKDINSSAQQIMIAKQGLSKQQGLRDVANADFIYFVDGVPQASFTADELMLVQTDVPVDISQYGFPSSTLENAVAGIISFLNMWGYNDRAFTGSMLDVILAMTGANIAPDSDTFTVIEEALQGFQGVNNAFRYPLVELYEGAKLEAIQMGKGNRDMQFDKIFQASVSIVAGVYRMKPDEFNIKGFSGEGQAMYEASQDYAMQIAKREGFGSEVAILEDTLTKLVQMRDPHYMFEFYGLDREDEKRKIEVEELSSRFKNTPNELRKSDGLREIDEEYCKEYGLPMEIIPFMNLPLHQGLQIALQQINAAKQQEKQMEQQQQQEQDQYGDDSNGELSDEDVQGQFSKSVETLITEPELNSKIFEDFGFTVDKE